MSDRLAAWRGAGRAVAAAAVALAAVGVEAGPVEDAFRGFIERLRGQGQPITEWRQALSFREVAKPVLEARVDALPLGREQFALFVTPGCRGCDAAVAHLRGQGLYVEVLDVSRSQTAREAYSLVQGHGFPTLLFGRNRLTGWNEGLFKRAWIDQIQDNARGQQGQGA